MAGTSPQRTGDLWQRLDSRRPVLVRLALSILKDHDEAEDVVQETLLRVWRRQAQGGLVDHAAYLSRATYWNALKRRARRRRPVALDAAGEPVATTPSEYETEQTLDAFELERAIQGLPVPQQTVIRLRFYVGLSFREIGERLAISTNTAASRTRYALASLRRALVGHDLDPARKGENHE